MKLIDVTASRLVPGPQADVFDVWLDPESPGGPWHGAKKVILQPEVDGLFYIGMGHAGAIQPHYGRFVTIERPRRVVHTWMSESTHGLESTVEISFEPRAGGTQMTIVHRGLPDDESGRGHERGWNYFLTACEEQFAARATSD